MPYQPHEPNHATLHPAIHRAMQAAAMNYSMATYDAHLFHEETVA